MKAAGAKAAGAKAATGKHSDRIWRVGERRRNPGRAARIVSVLVASALVWTLVVTNVDSAAAQDSAGSGLVLEDIQLRDELIANQESLLNVYRCLFDVDTQLVPGGCPNGKPAEEKTEPGSFSGTPTKGDIEIRDTLVVTQEALLNAYRCLFDVDTQVVPGGCPDKKSTEETPEATSTSTADSADDAPDQTITNDADSDESVIDVSVFYCAAESRGYNQADLIYETDRMTEVVGGFYSKESSGLSTVRFVPGGIVTPDLDWANSLLDGERKKLSDPNHVGIRSCFSEAEPPGEYEHFLFLVDMIPGAQGAFALVNWNVQSLGESVSIAVVPTVEARYEGRLSCSNNGGRPHRVREQPGTNPPRIHATLFTAGADIDCRYISYWHYLYLTAHEIGHSVYGLLHPPGCSIMSRGYTSSSKCPEVHLDMAEQNSNMLNDVYIDCVDREKLGWPVVLEECSSPPPPVEVSFELGSYSAEEGETAQVTVELDTVPFRTLTIPLTYTFQGGATAVDVGVLPSSVTFGASDTTKIISIPVNDDNVEEVGEGVQISFGSPLPADVSLRRFVVPVQTTVSFTDSAPPPVRVSFASATYTATEGTTAEVTVQLDTAPGRTLVIPIAATYLNGANHTDATRDQTSVTFEAHETTSTMAFTVFVDNLSEPGEGFKFLIEDYSTNRNAPPLPAGVSVGTPRQTIVTFTDAVPPGVEVSFGQATYTAAEGVGAHFTVELDKAPNRTVVIPLASSFQNGATAADFGTLPTSVKFEANETAKTLTFDVIDDQQSDPGETIQFSFGATLPDRVTQGIPSQATITVTDTGVPEVKVTFGSAAYTATEGTAAQVTLELDKAPNRTVIIPVTYTFGGGAAAADFGTLPTNVTFAANETAKTVTFTVTDDQISDPGESIKLAIGTTLPAKVISDRPNLTTVTITDTGVPQVTVTFASTTYTATEGTTTQFTVQLDKAPNRTVVIPLASSFQNGATAADFGTLPTSVTFTASETSKPVLFSVINDGLSDPGESIQFDIGTTLPTRVTAGTTNQTTVTITDTGVPQVEVNFGSAAFTVSEGSIAYVRLTLDKVAARTVTIPLTSSFQGGATAADFGTLPTSVTFAANETTKTVSFTVADDGLSDPGESIQFAIGTTLPTKVTAWLHTQTTVTITDTGVTPATVKFTSSTYSVTEGTLAQVRVTLDKAPGRTVIIPLTYTYQGGTTDADLVRRQASLTFDPTIRSITLGIGVIDDGLVDPGESFVVAIGQTLPDGVTAGTPSQTTVTITDTGITPVKAKFNSSTKTATEGTTVHLALTLYRDPAYVVPAGGDVVIPLAYTFQGGATESDFGRLQTGATFDSITVTVYISIFIVDDNFSDPGESLLVSLGETLPDGFTHGTPSQVTVTITDTG